MHHLHHATRTQASDREDVDTLATRHRVVATSTYNMQAICMFVNDCTFFLHSSSSPCSPSLPFSPLSQRSPLTPCHSFQVVLATSDFHSLLFSPCSHFTLEPLPLSPYDTCHQLTHLCFSVFTPPFLVFSVCWRL